MRTAAGEVVCFESARSAFLPDERSSNTPKRVHLMNHHPHILKRSVQSFRYLLHCYRKLKISGPE